MSKKPTTVGVLVGSTRPQRAGRSMADAIARVAADHDDVEIRMLDLRHIDLPWLKDPDPPSKGNYQHEHTKRWARVIAELDAIIVVTPQYNGGYPAPLKNAIDTIYAEWVDKPMLLVSYGGRGSEGGTNAIKQLREVFAVTQAAVLKRSVSIPLSRGDYAVPGRTLKDADAAVARHREEMDTAIGKLLKKTRG